VVPDGILTAIADGPLPVYVYDLMSVRQRAAAAVSLLDRCYYPIKAGPVEAVLRAAVEAGCGLDLCSPGDVALARAVGSGGSQWSFTSVHAPQDVLRELVAAGAVFDADSEEQMRGWRAWGGSACGVRVALPQDGSPYGVKFGVPAQEVGSLVSKVRGSGLTVAGLHIHESSASRSAMEWAARIEFIVAGVEESVFHDFRYINIGGGWPMREGWPVSAEELRDAIAVLRRGLSGRGFSGALAGEPGEWIVGPAGYWAAAVSAVKRHPREPGRAVIVLDTATPVPCRPSAAPFVLLRAGMPVDKEEGVRRYDLFGSANTGADTLGLDVPLPEVRPGDVIVSLCQGAYARSLTGSFNERPLPAVVAV
jgi:diaminopimelate decarboxylase